MGKKIKLVAIITGTILIVILIVLLSLSFGNSRDLVDDPNTPKKYRTRIITTKDMGNGLQTVVNKFDGYKITIPSDWSVMDTASFQEGLSIYSDPDRSEREYFDGVLLNLLVPENLEDVEVFVPEDTEFDEVVVNGEAAYVGSYKEMELGFDEKSIPTFVPAENGGTIAYIFGGGKRHYFIRCTVLNDENYVELLSQCAEQVQTFEMIK